MPALGKLISTAGLATRLLAVWKLVRHPRAPRSAKWVALAVLAYALSPIDLIPDFIPVLGQLDDLLLVPLGIALVVKLAPAPLWQECLMAAHQSSDKLPRVWWGVLLVLAVWLLVLGLFVWWLGSLLAAGVKG